MNCLSQQNTKEIQRYTWLLITESSTLESPNVSQTSLPPNVNVAQKSQQGQISRPVRSEEQRSVLSSTPAINSYASIYHSIQEQTNRTA